MATKQEIIRLILSEYPGRARLNMTETARVTGKHPNRVRRYMQGYVSEKSGVQRFYFIPDIAERMWKGSTT